MENDLLETIHQIIEITGNPYLISLFDKYRRDEKELNRALNDYLRGIYYEVNEEEDEDENRNKCLLKYTYLNGVVIDVGNISRLELDSQYNSKKNQFNYFIRVIKKYPSPLEEEYIIPFSSEKERDKGFEILKGKLKLCNIYIC